MFESETCVWVQSRRVRLSKLQKDWIYYIVIAENNPILAAVNFSGDGRPDNPGVYYCLLVSIIIVELVICRMLVWILFRLAREMYYFSCCLGVFFFKLFKIASNLHEFDKFCILWHTHCGVFFFPIFVTSAVKLFLARMTNTQALLFLQHSSGICQYQLDTLEFVKLGNTVNISQLGFVRRS